MTDLIERVGDSIIQHGRNNQRIYVMKSAAQDLPGLIDRLNALAVENNYSKIFAKVPSSQQEAYLENGFQVEASVPGLFNGQEKGVFLGKYTISERADEQQPAMVEKVISKAIEKQRLVSESDRMRDGCRPLFSDDMEDAAQLYRQVFASYPFPIDDADYLRSTMDHIVYYGIWHEDRMVALSSAEIDFDNANAEMTDFATLPEYEGNGCASRLLVRMESDMKDRGIPTLYTIARAYSYGMNITFAKNGYLFSGTLTNNTNISGGLESMNVWYKLLSVGRGCVE